jgi:hypothetical protein
MIRKEDREIYELAIEAYFDLIKKQEKSAYLTEAHECLELLEYFEEFEKCQDLVKIFPFLKE